jgi:murein DD-endopeptidase MepM/ murein hydrolase activator NlpD
MTSQALKLTTTRRALAVATVLAVSLAGGSAVGQDLQSELDSKRSKLEVAKQQEGVLTTELQRFNEEIARLEGEVATLRNREALVEQQLVETQARLDDAVAQLERLRDRLKRSERILAARLVDIYKSDQPDALTVLLDSDGFDDLVSRYDYLTRVQDQDALIVGRVRDLRNQTHGIVERVRAARDELAAREAELERTRVQLETRQAELDGLRDEKASALASIKDQVHELEGDISGLEDRIQAQLEAAQASTTTSDPMPAGPIQSAGGGWIWPVDGTLTSPFGYRWGRLHAGIDIAVPEGTPLRAAKSGTVAIAAYTGGYGNYTCVDHGGGISSCFAHQSGFAASAGDSVAQGDVIGYSGNTGNSTGPHLHFEIRVNGQPVDPLGYL